MNKKEKKLNWEAIKRFLERGEEIQAKRVFELSILLAESIGYRKGMKASKKIYDYIYISTNERGEDE